MNLRFWSANVVKTIGHRSLRRNFLCPILHRSRLSDALSADCYIFASLYINSINCNFEQNKSWTTERKAEAKAIEAIALSMRAVATALTAVSRGETTLGAIAPTIPKASVAMPNVDPQGVGTQMKRRVATTVSAVRTTTADR